MLGLVGAGRLVLLDEGRHTILLLALACQPERAPRQAPGTAHAPQHTHHSTRATHRHARCDQFDVGDGGDATETERARAHVRCGGAGGTNKLAFAGLQRQQQQKQRHGCWLCDGPMWSATISTRIPWYVSYPKIEMSICRGAYEGAAPSEICSPSVLLLLKNLVCGFWAAAACAAAHTKVQRTAWRQRMMDGCTRARLRLRACVREQLGAGFGGASRPCCA